MSGPCFSVPVSLPLSPSVSHQRHWRGGGRSMATATQEKQAKAEPAQDGKKERARSWSYPAFSLQEAVAKARILWEKENGNWIPAPVASEHWKFSAKSSSGIRAVA